jgi:hypothetical protein
MNYSEREGAYGHSYVNGGLMRLDQVGMDLTIPDGTNNGRDDMVNGDDSASQNGVGEEMPN